MVFCWMLITSIHAIMFECIVQILSFDFFRLTYNSTLLDALSNAAYKEEKKIE